jgi:hypothetical protein
MILAHIHTTLSRLESIRTASFENIFSLSVTLPLVRSDSRKCVSVGCKSASESGVQGRCTGSRTATQPDDK